MDKITKVSKEIDGKVEVTKTETVDKVEYISLCEGSLNHFQEVKAMAEEKIAYYEAELAKYKGK